LPYANNTASVKLPTVYPGARLVVVAPPSVQITGEGLQSGGQEQGMNIYSRDGLAPNSSLTVAISGTAPPPGNSASDTDAGAQNRDEQQGNGPAAGVAIQAVPGRLDVLKWPIVGGFLGIFALLAVLLARRPVVAVAGGPSESASEVPIAKHAKKAASAPASSSPASNTNMAQVDAAVGTSLDALKDTLFRLELRRQAGTISEEDYNQERARAEKVLRDLVRG
jgi:hypothetical protein